MSISACSNYLIPIPGSGYNVVNVPGPNSKGYTNVTDQLLYEIWQTNLLILAALNPPGMVIPIEFTIGDGQIGTPVAGTDTLFVPTLQGQALNDKTILVFRNGIQLQYSNAYTNLQIQRLNGGGSGGFMFDPVSGLTFQPGESYQLFVIGINTTIEP